MLKSNHSSFQFKSYAKLTFWNFQVGCAIILKQGIFQPNKNQYPAAEIIAEEYLSDIIHLERCHPKQKYREIFSFGHENSKDKLILPKTMKSLSSESGAFPLIFKPRGYCVLINNFVSYGTFKEFHRLRKIFYQMHFEVIMRQNLKAEEITGLLKKLSDNLNAGKIIDPPEEIEQLGEHEFQNARKIIDPSEEIEQLGEHEFQNAGKL
jgi:hypothetical protein